MQETIERKLFSSDCFKNASQIYAYVSYNDEVDTENIIKTSLSFGKKVAVPKCINSIGDMQFYYINSFEELKEGMYGILEPDEKICKKADDFSGALCIVPGVCFDMSNNRVGYGKGYYDRFLSRFRLYGVSAGLCFSPCLTKEIGASRHDEKVDIVFSDISDANADVLKN